VRYNSDSSGKSHGFLFSGGSFTTLDDPLGTNGTVVSGIVNTGDFVGSYIDSNSMVHGFFTGRVVGSNEIVPITLDNPLGTNGTTLFGVSTGTIVSAGGIVGDYTDSSNTSHGFLFGGGPLIPIDDPSGTKGTFVHGINDFGQIVGNYTDSSFTNHGFLYNGGSYTTLDDPLGTNGTFAYGINDTGQIVGIYIDSSNKTHSFLYSGGNYTTIDDPLGINGTTAFGINDAGQIVGQYIDGGGFVHGFLATPTGAIFPFTGDPLSQIEAIYIGYFGRAGDPAGTNFWTNQLLNGGSTAQTMTGIAASFSVQPESQAQYPFLANPLGATTSGASNQLDQFINSVYQNLFGRAADGTDTSGGLGFWRVQILNVLATHDSTALANELGSFILQVAYGAQGQDQAVLANKVTVADAITQTFSAHNIKFGNDNSTADQFAHTDIASVTASAASVTAAEVAIVGIVNSLI
jgi:probable HAF family extracellular repeat protein